MNWDGKCTAYCSGIQDFLPRENLNDFLEISQNISLYILNKFLLFPEIREMKKPLIKSKSTFMYWHFEKKCTVMY